MSRAVDKNGKVLILSKYTRLELKKLTKNNYYCLTCKKRLVLKVGERNKPHFSHVSTVNKNLLLGESTHHKLATKLLYESFKMQGFETIKECFIPSIQQRPDVILYFENENYAFEFQLSKISLSLLRKRTFNLKKVAYQPIWILSSRLLKMNGHSQLKITPFITQFIHRFSSDSPPQLFFLNPEQQKVIVLEHILLISQNHAYVQKRVIDLNELTPNKLKSSSQLNVGLLFSLWQREKYKFRTQVRKKSYGAEYRWRLWLYQRQLHFENLPSIVHLPSRDNYYFRTSPWDWQSRLYLKVIHPLKINEVFSYNECLSRVKKYLIPDNQFPLIDCRKTPVLNYLKLLTHLKIIKSLPNNKYIKMESVSLNDKLKESINADDDIINQLLYNLK